MIDEVKRDMNFDIKGAEFMARITKVQREKKSSWYHQAKEMKKIGGIDSKFDPEFPPGCLLNDCHVKCSILNRLPNRVLDRPKIESQNAGHKCFLISTNFTLNRSCLKLLSVSNKSPRLKTVLTN